VAYTLGASRLKVFYKVFLPATFPEVVDALRITMGWAWTYLIVAEIVSAERGIGSFILISERFLRSDRIIAAIITIGILGLMLGQPRRIGSLRVLGGGELLGAGLNAGVDGL